MRTELIEGRLNQMYQRAARDSARHLLAGMLPVQEAINMAVEEPDYRNYSYAGGGGVNGLVGGIVQKEQLQSDNNTLRAQSYRLYYNDPYVRNVIRTLVKFVFGKGVEIDVKPDEEKYQDITSDPAELDALKTADQVLVRQVKSYLKKFYDLNKWVYKQKEAGTRAFRDGEAFIYIRSIDAEDKVPRISFLEPDWIASEKPEITYGIETEPDDVENVRAYHVMTGRDATKREQVIEADKIVHIKLWVDSNVKRGRPVMEPVLNKVKMYDDWLNNRMVLNRVRSAVALVKYIEGTEGQLTAMNRAKKGTEELDRDNRTKMLVPGSVITAQKGAKYEFLAPNLGAVDAASDGKQLLTTIAAGVGFPEMFLSGDFSNANMASSYVAQNPIVREFEDYQDTFDMYFQELIRRVIKIGIEQDQLPEDAENLNVSVVWPPLIHRDLPTLVTALQTLYQSKVISLHTFCTETGHDFDEERKKINEERESMPPEDLGFDPFNAFGGSQQSFDQPIMQSEFDDIWRSYPRVNLDEHFEGFDEDDLDEAFPNHRGRPGKVGGSLPKNMSVTGIAAMSQRTWQGRPVLTRIMPTFDMTGKLGEALVQKVLGVKPLKSYLGLKQNNLAFDLVDSRRKILYEVKAGWSGNKPDAMKWRLTKGQYSKGEQEYYDRMTAAQRAKFNVGKDRGIIARKMLLKSVIEADKKTKFTVKTVTVIWNPDKKTADLFAFDGLHKEIRWRHSYVQNAYAGSYKFNWKYGEGV